MPRSNVCDEQRTLHPYLGRRATVPVLLLLFIILTANVGTRLGLERGDGGDILAAALCWSAIVLSLQRRWFLATFLLVSAMFSLRRRALGSYCAWVWERGTLD